MKKIILSAIAMVTISISAFAQSCNIDQSFTGTDNRQTIIGSDTLLPDGQSFKAGMSGALNAVALDISASNSVCSLTTMDVRVDILQGDSVTGLQLASQVYTLPVNITRKLDTFAFNNPASITAGQMYTVLFTLVPSQSCGTGEPQLIWYFQFPTNYWSNTGGTQFQNGVITSLGNTQYFTTCVSTVTGISDVEEETTTMSAVPNPFKNILTVTTKNEIKRIIVTNMLGKIVYSVKANGTKKEINLSLGDF